MSNTFQHTHKFGVECPETVEDALVLDKKNNNMMWVDTITKEMKNFQVAFEPLEDDIGTVSCGTHD